MNTGNPLPPTSQYPPSNALAAAIKRLPQCGPGVPPQTVDINAGPVFGRYSVTFVVRLNLVCEPPGRFWGIACSQKLGEQRA